jgi:hypothetical protein
VRIALRYCLKPIISIISVHVTFSSLCLSRCGSVRRGGSKDDPTQLVGTLQVTELVGAVSMLYGMLLHQGAPSRGSASPPPALPPHTIAVTIATIRLLNQVAELDLQMFQVSLSNKSSLRISLRLWQMSHYANLRAWKFCVRLPVTHPCRWRVRLRSWSSVMWRRVTCRHRQNTTAWSCVQQIAFNIHRHDILTFSNLFVIHSPFYTLFIKCVKLTRNADMAARLSLPACPTLHFWNCPINLNYVTLVPGERIFFLCRKDPIAGFTSVSSFYFNYSFVPFIHSFDFDSKHSVNLICYDTANGHWTF